MDIIYIIISLIVGLAIGILIGLPILKKQQQAQANILIDEAKNKAESIKQSKMLEAKEKFLNLKSEHEKELQRKNTELDKEIQRRTAEIQVSENRIKQKEQSLEDRIKAYKLKEDEVEKIKAKVQSQQNGLARK